MEISRELLDEQRRPRFGNANPERMALAFWKWVIIRGYGPHHVRDLFKLPLDRKDGPIWTFERMGATRSRLPDGRVICIGGEHEDFYDPDFCIYNDVVVLRGNAQTEIYGYPKAVFPPTDFHTATVTGGRILIVGGLGYKDARRVGHTPVYSLDLTAYSVSEFETSGAMPGWIFKHEASFDASGFVTIRGGQIVEERDGKQIFRSNFEDYALDITSGVWRLLTNRNWRQFRIQQEDGKLFVLERRPRPDSLVPIGFKGTVVPRDESSSVQFVVNGIPVALKIDIQHVEIVVEGNLPDDVCRQLTETIRINTEGAIGHKCVTQQV